MSSDVNEAFEPSGRRVIPVQTAYAPTHSCSPAVRMRVLSRTPLFAGLDAEALREIDARMVNFHTAAGDDIHRQGEPARYFHVLAAGRLKAVRSSADGQRVVVDLLGSGDAFGGIDTFGRTEYGETVTALTSTCMLRIDAEGFHRILRAFPSVALRLIDDLSAQLIETREAMTQRSTAVTQRVAATLLRLAEKFGEPAEGGILIQMPLTRADLAGLTGSTPESVSRAMSRMRRAGLVESGRRWTRIIDAAGLAAAASADD
ncbi:Crp/Fnr family transcriptional regulator [Agrococcus lahaulensis]|uniref:Crp/Fnr family transcriptional regulator n=1 Tax=Agrococcus lahaulensis TaxID=341722 RepID=UPI001FDEC27E|nr:Crp/Fnr family transcriptional regulator [Agrococcus lahaulensis]